MIASRIEASIIEIPVVIRKYDEIGLSKMPLPIVKTLKEFLVRCGVRTGVRKHRGEFELIVDADHAIRISG